MYAGALFIQEIFEWDLYLAVSLILAITALYTIIGKFYLVVYRHSRGERQPMPFVYLF